jgi:hypothetical protein
VRSVETLGEVVAFLDHWPYARRDPAYQTAMDLAQKATVGYVTVDEARDAFWAFAAEAKILAESNVAGRRAPAGPADRRDLSRARPAKRRAASFVLPGSPNEIQRC